MTAYRPRFRRRPAPDATPARQLADALADRLLTADPFHATSLGLREYDALVPDPSAAAEDQLAADLARSPPRRRA